MEHHSERNTDTMKNCFYPADILLPRFASDAEKMRKWACIACAEIPHVIIGPTDRAHTESYFLGI